MLLPHRNLKQRCFIDIIVRSEQILPLDRTFLQSHQPPHRHCPPPVPALSWPPIFHLSSPIHLPHFLVKSLKLLGFPSPLRIGPRVGRSVEWSAGRSIG